MSKAMERFIENKKLSPFRDLLPHEDAFERLFNDLTAFRRSNTVQPDWFAPSCEILEDKANYLLKFDLPGVPKDKVKVEINDDQLTVSAERREEKTDQKKCMSEISYGSFTRSFTLPGPVDEKQVNAVFDNGVLSLTIPKTQATKAKEITIK